MQARETRQSRSDKFEYTVAGSTCRGLRCRDCVVVGDSSGAPCRSPLSCRSRSRSCSPQTHFDSSFHVNDSRDKDMRRNMQRTLSLWTTKCACQAKPTICQSLGKGQNLASYTAPWRWRLISCCFICLADYRQSRLRKYILSFLMK